MLILNNEAQAEAIERHVSHHKVPLILDCQYTDNFVEYIKKTNLLTRVSEDSLQRSVAALGSIGGRTVAVPITMSTIYDELRILQSAATPDITAGEAPATEPDMINHPPHYKQHPSGIECIQVTGYMSFNLGNAIKYIWRADHKGTSNNDLRKAIWYITQELKQRGESV
jgi:hypothetical protein